MQIARSENIPSPEMAAVICKAFYLWPEGRKQDLLVRSKKSAQRGSFGDGCPADIRGSFARISRPKTSVRALKILEKQAFGRGHPWPEGVDVHDPKGFPKTLVRKTLGWIFVPYLGVSGWPPSFPAPLKTNTPLWDIWMRPLKSLRAPESLPRALRGLWQGVSETPNCRDEWSNSEAPEDPKTSAPLSRVSPLCVPPFGPQLKHSVTLRVNIKRYAVAIYTSQKRLHTYILFSQLISPRITFQLQEKLFGK